MSRKKKLEPNWDIVKPNLLKNSVCSVNQAYREYSRAVVEFFKYSGFDNDGRWCEYNGLREKMNEKKEIFYTELEEHLRVMKIIKKDDREAMLAILEGRFEG